MQHNKTINSKSQMSFSTHKSVRHLQSAHGSLTRPMRLITKYLDLHVEDQDDPNYHFLYDIPHE